MRKMDSEGLEAIEVIKIKWRNSKGIIDNFYFKGYLWNQIILIN